MGVIGILVLIYMRLGPMYMRREIEKYEDEFYDEEEKEVVSEEGPEENPFENLKA